MATKQTYEYRFKIDAAYTPETMPMARLAEYIRELSTLLGNQDKVHFDRLEEGSTVPIIRVDHEAFPKVEERLNGVEEGQDAPPIAIKAYQNINKHLAADNATGSLFTHTGQEIIYFPGCERPQALGFGPFNQEGAIDGVVIRIGGESDPVPVHLQESGKVHICSASRIIAKDLGAYLFGPTIIRVLGVGRWKRTEDNEWEMVKFKIDSFEELESISLSNAVTRLREIDSPIQELEDPAGEILRFRKGQR